MGQEPLPFLSDDVARAKKRTETIRIFGMAIAMCLILSLNARHPLQIMPRMVLFDAVPFGLLILFVRRVVPTIQFKSFGRAVVFRSLTYTLVFAAAIELAAISVPNGWSINEMFLKHPSVLAITLVLCYSWVLIVTSIRGVSKKLGRGEFWNWIRGYYFSPKEEERIFMFLDIRGSTELAEKLGDLRFSRLVRDFFDDLTGPIVETRATVSHYIGDEAVLTWWPKDGLNEGRCIQCFFRMQAVIDKRRSHYMDEYGMVPGFKAGAHIGRVVATEVGQVKSEIVFHGDVLNTTARVQAACSEHGVDFLITEALSSRLPEVSWLELEPIGEVVLKGKSEPVALLSASVRTK